MRIDGVQSHPSPNTYTTQNRNDHLDPFMGLPWGRGGQQSGNCQAGKPLAVRCCPLVSELRVLPVLAGVRTPPQSLHVGFPRAHKPSLSGHLTHSGIQGSPWSGTKFPSQTPLGPWDFVTLASLYLIVSACPVPQSFPPLPHRVQGLRLTLLSFQSQRAVSTY